MGADNQQERLIKLGWVIGFVDGEGCFSIGFVRQPDREGRKGYKTGYQVSHEFAVTQGAKSIRCLEELRGFFGVGQVLPNRMVRQPQRAPVPVRRAKAPRASGNDNSVLPAASNADNEARELREIRTMR